MLPVMLILSTHVCIWLLHSYWPATHVHGVDSKHGKIRWAKHLWFQPYEVFHGALASSVY